MVNPGLTKYEVVLQNKYFLRELIESLMLEDRLDEIAYTGTVRLAVPGDQFTGLPVIQPGMEMRISGVPFGQKDMVYLLNPGVAWDVTIENRARRHWEVKIYDKTIYLAKSDDEYIFTEGTTATQRIKQIASDWGIAVDSIADTGQPLAKGVHRAKSIWSIMQSCLAETAQKSGRLFRLRMTPNGLSLFELGTNDPVWVIEFGVNFIDVTQKQTLEGTITQVKVLGNASGDERSPIVANVKGEVDKLGTLQKIFDDKKAIDSGTAQKKAENMLSGIQETVNVTAIDINTIRAGDKVHVEGWPELIAISVQHTCGSPGRMALELATKEYIRRKYYDKESV